MGCLGRAIGYGEVSWYTAVRTMKGGVWFLIWLSTAILALVLGLIGFQIDKNLIGPAFYKTLQLYFLNGSTSEFHHPATWVAAFCGAVSSIVGLAAIFLHAFHEQVKLFRLKFFKDYVIFVGLGDKTMMLAKTLKNAPKVVVDPSFSLEHEDDFLAMNGIIIHGSGSDPEIWKRFDLRNALRVFILTGSDQTNADAETALRQVTKGKVPIYACYDDPLLAIALGESHMHRQRLSDLNKAILDHEGADGSTLWALASHGAGDSSESGREVGDAVNIPLKAYEVFWETRTEGSAILVGDGPLLEAAIIEWCNVRTTRSDINTTLTVYGPNADEVVARLKEWHGACAVADASLSGQTWTFAGTLPGAAVLSAKYVHVTSEDDDWNLRRAVMIANGGALNRVEITCGVLKSPGLAALVGDGKKAGYVRGIGAINLYEHAAHTMSSPRTELDRLVEACYAAYLGSTGQALDKVKKMSDGDRLATLAQAIFFVEALERRGLNVSRIAGTPAVLSEEELNFLAEREHERWRFEKLADGFRYSPERSDKSRPMLLPWSEKWNVAKAPGEYQIVSNESDFVARQQAMMQHDRQQLEAMLENLAQQGVRLVRL